MINSIIEYFINQEFLDHSSVNHGYKLTKVGFDKLHIWAALAKTFIESYWIASTAISQAKDEQKKNADLLKSMNYIGKRFLKLGTIEHMGALSQINFRNAINLINKYVQNPSENSEIDHLDSFENISQFSKKLYNFSHFN